MDRRSLEEGILNNIILQVDIDFIATVVGAAIIGSLIGAFATYCFARLIENMRNKNERRKEKEFRKGVTTIIRQELESYHKFLNTQLVKVKHVPSDNSVKVLEYRDSFMNELSGLSRQYINLSAEVKAKVFDSDTLVTLEKVYQYIQEYNLVVGQFEGNIKLFFHNIDDGLRAIREYENRLS